jgi:ATP-dependent DNA ligase
MTRLFEEDTTVSFTTPMLAASMPKFLNIEPGIWALEQKYDGHRIMVRVEPNRAPIAWSRNGIVRALPPHIILDLVRLPRGVYDGELFVPGDRSFGVKEIANGPNLIYVVFDIVDLLGVSIVQQNYDERRAYLEEIQTKGLLSDSVMLSPMWHVKNNDDVDKAVSKIWAKDGEGVILKRRKSTYVPGKRPKDAWIKIKALRTAVLEVVGFIPSKGEIQYRGNYGMVQLRDEDGNETTVKTRNDKECRALEERARVGRVHPDIGRKLRIEFQERTPDGSYRHPRWDRWEDE